jgi:hypothetical protein
VSTALRDTYQKARKRRLCDLCGRWIDLGEEYHYGFYVDYGDHYGFSTCAHCDQYMSPIFQSDQWDSDTGVGPDCAEDFDPRTWAEMRLKVWYRRRWRRRDGTLIPVPRLVWARVFYPRRSPWQSGSERVVVACVINEGRP